MNRLSENVGKQFVKSSRSSHEKTLEEARDEFELKRITTGGICPCCNRKGRRYSRNMNLRMVHGLIWIFKAGRESESGLVQVSSLAPRELVKTNQFQTLAWWGLIAKGPTAGTWLVTAKGEEFVLGEILVPSRVLHYNAKPEGFEGAKVSIKSFFERGQYERLMEEPIRYRT